MGENIFTMAKYCVRTIVLVVRSDSIFKRRAKQCVWFSVRATNEDFSLVVSCGEWIEKIEKRSARQQLPIVRPEKKIEKKTIAVQTIRKKSHLQWTYFICVCDLFPFCIVHCVLVCASNERETEFAQFVKESRKFHCECYEPLFHGNSQPNRQLWFRQTPVGFTNARVCANFMTRPIVAYTFHSSLNKCDSDKQ